MRITVRFFAVLKDRAGLSESALDLPEGCTISMALESLSKQYPAIRRDLQRAAFAVNRTYVKPDSILNDNDELALIPPVSGG